MMGWQPSWAPPGVKNWGDKKIFCKAGERFSQLQLQKRLSGVDSFISKKALRRGHFYIYLKKGSPAWTFSYLFQTRLSGVDIFISKKALKALLCGHFHTRMKIEIQFFWIGGGSWGGSPFIWGGKLPPRAPPQLRHCATQGEALLLFSKKVLR